MKSTLTLLMVFCAGFLLVAQTPSGELKRWHKVTLSFTGPNTSETANPNPFSDYRLDVTFSNGSSSYTVPGYYAGCEDPAESSCDSGAIWKVHFAPGKTGTWNWTASFKSGANVAINGGGSSAGFMDGDTGSFDIAESDKTGRDHRSKEKGMLQYVGEHYLRYSGTDPENPNGNWFVKGGADSPENALAYNDFDDTPNRGNRRKNWQPHQQDYDAGDAAAYTWKNGKGTEMLGMIKYLSDKGLNAFSFLTLSLHGDDENVFPHRLKVGINTYNGYNDGQQWNQGVHKDRFDVSKMAQWEKLFEYGDKKGMFMHFKTMETENDNIMDNNTNGRQRKLYYRELIARFGHHLALNWNITEESTIPDNVVKDIAAYIKAVDPYDHHIVLHTYPNQRSERYTPLLGNKSELTGPSIQTNNFNIHGPVKEWVDKSRNAGKKWVVACDEPGNAQIGIDADPKDNNTVREEVLWPTFMAGGMGVEYYYGYETGETDLSAQDHRSRDTKYTHVAHALRFLNANLQEYLPNMRSADGITSDNGDHVYAQTGKVYVVYRPNGGTTGINLPSGTWQVQWYNPRSGGALSSAQAITNSLVAPDTNDWVALIKGEATDPDPDPDPDCDNLASVPTQDAYLEGTKRLNTDELRVEQGNRVSYLQFIIPATDEEVKSIKLRLTVNDDPGQGTIDVYKGSSNNWTEGNLSDSNKPSQGTKIGSISGSFNEGQSYDWTLSGVSQGETVSLVLTHSGSDDVSFYSKEGSVAPQILVEAECTTTGGDCKAVNLSAISDFPNISVSGFSPAYIDNQRGALAIDASLYKDKFAAAEVTFSGETSKYDITLNTLSELDGESTYRVVVGSKLIGTFQNPETNTDYAPAKKEFKGISITKGDVIRVEFNSHTNGKIPEGGGTAFSRGRWTSLQLTCVGGDPDPDPDPDPNTCVPTEQNGIVAVEAETFFEQEKTTIREWYIRGNGSNAPGPDPDNHNPSTASGGQYIEILPDTRVYGHNDVQPEDELIHGENFSNVPGVLAIVKYKVYFNNPGKYFVWVRTNFSGKEDNGVHVGIDGTWPESGQRMQWCGTRNVWTWDSKQRTNANHCGEARGIFLNVPTKGEHIIQFSMREDGFEMDKFILSKEYNKPSGAGIDVNLENCNLSVGEVGNPLKNLYVSPVPATDLLSLHGFTGKAVISVHDMFGKELISGVSINGSGINTINIERLPQGMYFLSARVNDVSQTLKFLKK